MATDYLNPANSPNNTGDGVRRLNKLPIILVMAAVMLTMVGIVYALNSRKAIENAETGKTGNSTIGNNPMAEKMLAGIGDGIVDSTKGETIVIDNTTESTQKNSAQSSTTPLSKDMPNAPMPVEEDEEAKRIRSLVQDFQQRNFYDAIVARTASEEIPNYSDGENNVLQNSVQHSATNPQMATLLQSLASQGIQSQTTGMQGLLEQQDPNLRLRKESFASNSSNPYHYSLSSKTAQLTPYEIRVGSIIPAVMISGINSDLPGDIIAQVSQDVRDTKTGRFVLIPQGSKLIGRYDSHVAMGQERVMIAWYRLQFPDASTFDLDNMGAVDLAGYAGMRDKVNNHTFRLFKNAFLLSVIGAGAQIAIGEDNNQQNSPINATKSELGRQFGQLGTEMIKRNMNIQPTLEIRPGYRFNVMVNKDLILQPYP